jgi:hypothetical protein
MRRSLLAACLAVLLLLGLSSPARAATQIHRSNSVVVGTGKCRMFIDYTDNGNGTFTSLTVTFAVTNGPERVSGFAFVGGITIWPATIWPAGRSDTTYFPYTYDTVTLNTTNYVEMTCQQNHNTVLFTGHVVWDFYFKKWL